MRLLNKGARKGVHVLEDACPLVGAGAVSIMGTLLNRAPVGAECLVTGFALLCFTFVTGFLAG